MNGSGSCEDMYEMKERVVAIIPARGGSKRIPNKNIKMFAGRPLIVHSLDAAKKSMVFDRIIVSTDSSEIAEIAQKAGAEVPFMRPPELADDYTPTIPVLKHALNWLMSHNCMVEYFCCIYANPFITSKNLISAFDLLKEKQVTGVIPVTTFEFPIFRGIKISEDSSLEYIFPKYASSRSQDLHEAYHDVGQFYWWDCKKYMAAKEIALVDRIPYIIPRHLCQDIDTPEDWDIAEKLYNAFVAEK